jgi:hypothetical protein
MLNMRHVVTVVLLLAVAASVWGMLQQRQQRKNAESKCVDLEEKCARLDETIRLKSWASSKARSFWQEREAGRWPVLDDETSDAALTALYDGMTEGLVLDTQLLTNEKIKRLIRRDEQKWVRLIRANEEARRAIEKGVRGILDDGSQELPRPREAPKSDG